ncbi:hypothetical protein DIPPA_14561 [Diplonema papillatum]|nr:hypothetical protein DIPPA_23292 [Diplonema papillatum]KAJ9436270.1 hypothetical protein DIPPA_23293 [Diplonema papillatum]KAJ9437892.1 hypothetical protein DIPPA_20725 [Diplonema papillatum]KAJ9437894.1 hypothetical protein DIPPA_20723 [Diplonema papillatum]KAJ9455610.1 hypothetical protein DIPPA_14560 [Diplonema papillatum]
MSPTAAASTPEQAKRANAVLEELQVETRSEDEEATIYLVAPQKITRPSPERRTKAAIDAQPMKPDGQSEEKRCDT